MIQRIVVGGLLVTATALGLVACGGEATNAAATTSGTSTTSTTSTTMADTTTIPSPSSTTTSVMAPTTTVVTSTPTTSEERTPPPASILGLGVHAPLSGWIASETPYVMTICFCGQPPPDSVTLNSEPMIDEDPRWHQYWSSSPIDLAPGVNLLHLAVEYQGETIEEADIPVTYLEGAEELLGWIITATNDSIAVDPTEWNDDQEFPGPEDPDPDARTNLPVADQVRVIISAEIDVNYEWFTAEVNAGYVNVQGLPGLDDWNPDGVYPYTITIHNGQVVQIWKIPLG